MRRCRGIRIVVTVAIAVGLGGAARAQMVDPLPSWNEGPSKRAITTFVQSVVTEGSPDFLPAELRIATFDNDGTLWCEQPAYFQLMFAFDRIRALAHQHPEWKDNESLKMAMAGDMHGLRELGTKGLLEVVATTHSGLSADEFSALVKDWLKVARHPRFDRPYLECVYQPMLELLHYLRAQGFKTFIVSGGGVEFMRAFAEHAYGVPPEQVVGSCGSVKFELQNGKPVLLKEPAIEFIDDGPGKPVGIHRFIGRRPIFAAGNSDGDLQMLQYTTIDHAPSFALLVHHNDGEREYAYDRTSAVGRLNQALDEAMTRGWTVVDMKNEWNVIFPATPK